jgi:hypothetical protein
MDTSSPETFFDSPQKEGDSVVKEQQKILSRDPSIKQILEGYPDIVVILNSHRQIIASNSKTLEALEVESAENVIGKRLGEAINCIHAFNDPSGCGTTKFCKLCGAANAIKTTKDFRKSDIQECRIIRKMENGTDPLDLRIHTTPVNIEGHDFTITAVENIASEKRREALERIFFHDILNTAGALEGYAGLLKESESQEEIEEFASVINNISGQIIREIKSQRQLLQAENGTLETELTELSVNETISKVFDMFANHPLAEGITFKKELLDEDAVLLTDSTLLNRSLSNLVKNALEASKNGDEVKIYVNISRDKIIFNVYNDNIIPESIQMQIFQRSFSTKSSKGRGIGTYSVKLLIEKYLNGKVYFESGSGKGTIFSIELQLQT